MSGRVSCQNFDVFYGANEVLHSIDFEVNRGELVALVGPNGSGKSTLLKALSAQIDTWKGSAYIGERDLRTMSPSDIAAEIAFVPQSEPPVFGFRVLDVVMMGRNHAQTRIFDQPQDQEIAFTKLRQVGIDSLAERAITELSGGELQRVWMARALAQGSPVLFLDEPTSHLDVAHVLEFGALFKELAETGMCLVLAIHDLNMALEIATRVCVLAHGRMTFDGTPEACRQSGSLEAAFAVRFEQRLGYAALPR